MDKNVWIARNNQVFGPYLFSTLTTDNVLPTDYVGESPNGPWIPAQAFEGFGGLQQHHQPPSLPTAQANAFEDHYRCICPLCNSVQEIWAYANPIICANCASPFSLTGVPVDFDLRAKRAKSENSKSLSQLGMTWAILGPLATVFTCVGLGIDNGIAIVTASVIVGALGVVLALTGLARDPH